MSEFKMLIGGKLAKAGNTFGVINPATGEVFAQAPDCSKEQVEQAIEAAHQAFPKWSRDMDARRKVLKDMGSALMANQEELAKLLTQEQGKPLRLAKIEIMGGAMILQMAADTVMPVEVIQDDEKLRMEIRRKPYGVVAAITPWNFPVSLAMGKIATSLITGNTVVLKPSPFTPIANLRLSEILLDIVPAGVLNIITGSDSIGSVMTDHPLVRKIDFTGSVATGKKVALSAAPDLKRVTLELGGNDPAIVLGDVDPEKIAKKLFWGAFTNSGQVCTAIKRMYIHESVYDKIVENMAAIAKRTQVGNGMDEKTVLGPINNKPQFDRVTGLVEDAVSNGAKIMAGGHALGEGGYCFESTIITNVTDETRIVAEEQFGPVLPILSFKDVDEVIERANHTHFGLSASVWSADENKAIAVAEQMESATAWVNQHMAPTPLVPFGGSKWSGIGYVNGRWGVEGATEIQVINIKKN